MDPTLRTSCPECGPIEVDLPKTVLRVSAEHAGCECLVRCPECGERFTKQASEPMAVMLITAGINVSVWNDDAVSVSDGNPMTAREIERFVERLSSDDDALLAGESLS